MMPVLIAATALVGCLCLLDLLLTFGVIRRLREHTKLLTSARAGISPELGLSAGERPGPFRAITAGGERVDGAAGLRVVAFFSSSCSICPERVPPFADYVQAQHLERDSVLVVSVGPEHIAPPYLDELAGLARICLEKEDGEIATAFAVTGSPVFFQLDANGVVVSRGWHPSRMPEPVAL
jgi:hypothetical protein